MGYVVSHILWHWKYLSRQQNLRIPVWDRKKNSNPGRTQIQWFNFSKKTIGVRHGSSEGCCQIWRVSTDSIPYGQDIILDSAPKRFREDFLFFLLFFSFSFPSKTSTRISEQKISRLSLSRRNLPLVLVLFFPKTHSNLPEWSRHPHPIRHPYGWV